MSKPYVVSLDIDMILKKWEGLGFVLPSKTFFDELRQGHKSYLETIFDNVIFLSGHELISEVNSALLRWRENVISLNNVYTRQGNYIALTRTVDEKLNDVGIKAKSGFNSLSNQISKLPKGEYCLFDDVVFTGGTVIGFINQLAKHQIYIKEVVCAIGIQPGLVDISKHVDSVIHIIKYEDVIDEICERDFFPGIEMSGRSIEGSLNYGAPYMLPFGKPDRWASIPEEKCAEYSIHCIDLSIKLFQEIERLSRRRILYGFISRKPKFPFITKLDERFVELLEKSKSYF